LEGFNARIFQHEFDHLDKILFIDRFNEADKAENQKRLDKVDFFIFLNNSSTSKRLQVSKIHTLVFHFSTLKNMGQVVHLEAEKSVPTLDGGILKNGRS